jgi:hypothetical protein
MAAAGSAGTLTEGRSAGAEVHIIGAIEHSESSQQPSPAQYSRMVLKFSAASVIGIRLAARQPGATVVAATMRRERVPDTPTEYGGVRGCPPLYVAQTKQRLV